MVFASPAGVCCGIKSQVNLKQCSSFNSLWFLCRKKIRWQQAKDLPLFSLKSSVTSFASLSLLCSLVQWDSEVQHPGALVRGRSLLPPLNGLGESVLQKSVPLIPSPLPASLRPQRDNSTGLSTTECNGAEIFPGLLFFTCPLWALADREHLCEAEVGHRGLWAGFFSCSLQLFLESPQQHGRPQCFLSNVGSWEKEQQFLQCFQHRPFFSQSIDICSCH